MAACAHQRRAALTGLKPVRRHSHDGLVDHQAEAVEVDPVVVGHAQALLRTHVCRRPSGGVRVVLLVPKMMGAEVQYDGGERLALAGEVDIGGLDVAVSEAETVDTRQRPSHLSAPPADRLHAVDGVREWSHVLVERDALGHLHGEEEVPLVCPCIEHVNDAGNAGRPQARKLRPEALRVSVVGVESSLDGDGVARDVACEPHVAFTTASDAMFEV